MHVFDKLVFHIYLFALFLSINKRSVRMQKPLISIFLFAYFIVSNPFGTIAQVGINESSSPPNPSSMLDIESTSKGLLIPRMTEVEKNNISNPSHSLLVYQTDAENGFYFNSGSPAAPSWMPLGTETVASPIKIPIDTLPFTISSSGAYYLVSSLNASTGSNGITITASNVTIDLNGNGIVGDGSGTFDGITTTGSIQQLSIYNGFVSNWGGYGINTSTATSISVSHIQVEGNGFAGINSGQESTLINCKAVDNGLDGINSSNSSTIINCFALDNGSDGIDISNYGTIINCHTKSNGGNGIETSAHCKVKDCVSYSNSDNGIYIGSGSSVSGSISSSNTLAGFELLTGSKGDNNQSRSNSQNGFEASNDVILTNNLADNNTLSGFFCDGSDARLDNNQSTDNGQHGFNITGSGNLILKNSASGNISLAYNILAGNTAGTVITAATFNTNTNPFANISF